MNPRAFYVSCAAHSLNFVVNEAAKSDVIISEATKMINLVKKDLEKYRTDSAFEVVI